MNKILARQLKKLGLDETAPPTSIETWHELLKKIDNYYDETDADRYRLERSMDVSSNEMQELNSKLQSAQKTAKLGYWSYNTITNENIWSLSLYDMFGFDLAQKTPSLDEVYELIHPEDKEKFHLALENAKKNCAAYEIQVRFRNVKSNNYKWIQAICQPSDPINGTCTKLSGIAMDIDERKNSELEVERLNSQLIDTARRAGMSEVATSMLHNIGNVLNSANTTAEWIKNELNNLIYDRTNTLTKLLIEHKDNLPHYMEHDPAGQKIPEYLIGLNQRLVQSNQHLKIEIESLITHLTHISEITSIHKSVSGVAGVKEKIKISHVVDEAVSICSIDLNRNKIELIKNVKNDMTLDLDKNKLIQIIINLIKNAIDAVAACPDLVAKKIAITIDTLIDEDNEKQLLLTVADNGIGINEATLQQLFKFGFTTKKTGHGFGLHGSAINAKEINATLHAESKGHMQGAKFSLAFPIKTPVGAN